MQCLRMSSRQVLQQNVIIEEPWSAPQRRLSQRLSQTCEHLGGARSTRAHVSARLYKPRQLSAPVATAVDQCLALDPISPVKQGDPAYGWPWATGSVVPGADRLRGWALAWNGGSGRATVPLQRRGADISGRIVSPNPEASPLAGQGQRIHCLAPRRTPGRRIRLIRPEYRSSGQTFGIALERH